MIRIRRGAERGGGEYGWLNTRHTFSFSDYWDPRWMGFRSLRLINEDYVAPAAGFPTHPHQRHGDHYPTCSKASWSTKTAWGTGR